MTRFLETMEVTMMSNFEDIETRMIANVTKMQNELHSMVNSSAIALANDIAELTSDWNSTTHNMSRNFETMESHLKDIETKMIANIEMKQNELQFMISSSLNSIAEHTSDWNPTTHSMSKTLETMEKTMMSHIEDIETRMVASVEMKQNETQESLRNLQADLGFLSKNVSSVSSLLSSKISSETSLLSSKINSVSSSLSSSISSVSSSLSSSISSVSSSLSSRLSSETSSLSSRISSVSYSLSSEASSLSSRISSLSSSISSLSSRMSAKEQAKVAFSVGLGSFNGYFPSSTTISFFNRVYMNVGGGFSTYYGTFTAPKPGTYLFSVTIFSLNNELVTVVIKKNGGFQGEAMAGDESNASGSTTVVMQLYTGDRVWVETTAYQSKFFVRPNFGNFAGVLID